MSNLEYHLTEREAELAFAQISAHCQALKNWIVDAVERFDNGKAQSLATDLREHQKLFAKLNVPAHRMIEEARPKLKSV